MKWLSALTMMWPILNSFLFFFFACSSIPIPLSFYFSYPPLVLISILPQTLHLMLRADLLKHCCIHPPTTPHSISFLCVALWLVESGRASCSCEKKLSVLPCGFCSVVAMLLEADWPSCYRHAALVCAGFHCTICYLCRFHTLYTTHTSHTYSTFSPGPSEGIKLFESVMCVCAICTSSYLDNQTKAERESCHYVLA